MYTQVLGLLLAVGCGLCVVVLAALRVQRAQAQRAHARRQLLARLYRYTHGLGCVALLLVGTGCAGASATAPAATAPAATAAPVPAPPVLHHNIPATTAAGAVVWLCSTQPRQYMAGNGTVNWQVDHYIQGMQCPVVPIQ